jgi:hypothetical protein
MLPFNPKKQINDVGDFNDYCVEIWEAFLNTFTKENGLIRDVNENDNMEDAEFMYTGKGARLASKMRERLFYIGEVHFPKDYDWIEIESNQFRED